MVKKIKRKLGNKIKEHIEEKYKRIGAKKYVSPRDARYVVRSFDMLSRLPGNRKKYRKLRDSITNMIEQNLDAKELTDAARVREVFEDVLFCNKVYGFKPQEYFTYELEKLSHIGRKTFVSTFNKKPYYAFFNNQNYNAYLNKKTEMHRMFSKYYGREALAIYEEEDRKAFLEFIERHPKFIYKPSDDAGGRGIKIIDSSRVTSGEDLFDILLSQGSGIAEELIEQGEELAQFHPASVNTVRAVTFLNSEKEPEIQWCFLRMGMGGNYTDNASGGGLSAMIDPETGVIYSVGRDYKGDVHISHPDTNVRLVGFEMPEWDKAKALLKELSNVLPELRLVGWDLAYSKNGWVLVEGNSRPQCVSPQISTYNGKFYLLENIKKVLEEERKGQK